MTKKGVLKLFFDFVFFGCIVLTLSALIAGFTIVYILKSNKFTIMQVRQYSMAPAIQDGDSTLVYLNNEHVDRHDIVCVKVLSLLQGPMYLVKRVIGMPGDKVEIVSGHLYVNDKIQLSDFTSTNIHLTTEDLYYALGEDEYFIMGDNRLLSSDSRHFGPITKDSIFGEVILINNN